MNFNFCKLRPALFLSLALFAFRAPARENSYDVVGKVLRPLANLFVAAPKTPNRALTTELSIQQATGLAPAAAGETISIQMQYPDKLLVNLPALGLTVCRNGQQIWASPGAVIAGIITSSDLPPGDPDLKLAPFQLPVTDNQLVFLPALFQVADAGDESVDGVNCRVTDVSLMPEVARSLKLQDWVARLWVRPDYTAARVEVARGKWYAVIAVKKLAYAPSLPLETWQATPSQRSQGIVVLDPARYKQLLDAILPLFTRYKQANAH